MWVLASLASGCLLASAWPPHSGTHAVWVALAPLLLFVNGCRSPWRAFRAAWLAGFVYFLIIAYPALSLIWWGWAQTAAEYRASWLQQHIFLWIWYPVSSCFGGLGWGTWAAALVWLGRGRSPWRNLWLAPALWMIYEYAAGWIFFDFTWGAVGYMLHPYFRLRQFASVAGIYGLGGLVVLVNAWVAHALRVGWGVAHRDRGPAGPLPLRREAALLAGVLLVLALAFETPALTRRPGASVPGAGASLSVAALQAEMRELTVDELKSGALDWGYEPLLRSALDGGAELVVLPESVWLAELALDAVPTPRTLSPAVSPVQVMSYLGPKLAPRRAVLINGFDVTEQGRMYNSMVAWDATGMLGRYDKRRLTPFAEYPPGPFNLLAPANRITYSAGRGNHLFSVHGIPVGGFICLEVHFPFVTRRSAGGGAQILVSTGNDAIFGDPAVAAVHHVMAAFRAVENHRPLVRAIKGGISAIFDPEGRVVGASGLGERAVLRARVEPSSQMTLYTRWGDWLVALAAAILLVISAPKAWVWFRGRSAPSASPAGR